MQGQHLGSGSIQIAIDQSPVFQDDIREKSVPMLLALPLPMQINFR